jgi:acyl carrier protein
MGLDVVELVMRCEEEFGVELENDRLEGVRTVGDLFEIICDEVKLPSGPNVPRPAQRQLIPVAAAPKEGLTRDPVWLKLVEIIAEELQIDPDEMKYEASFDDDLGAD